MASPRPLDGITVVSLEHAIAAPFCTRQLADLGARVIKVERPGPGDFARAYDTRVRGQASHFVWTNRSKESLTLDLKQPQAMAVLRELLQGARFCTNTSAPCSSSPSTAAPLAFVSSMHSSAATSARCPCTWHATSSMLPFSALSSCLRSFAVP